MVAVIVVFAITIALMLITILFKPNLKFKKITVSAYWVVALLGAISVIVTNLIGIKEVGAGLLNDSAINPLKILALFLSMTVLSIFLDEVGFFRYFADYTLRKAKTSAKKLFLYLYLTVSVLTVFTSNDIIVLTFTPFICYFAKNSKLNPIPFLMAEFVAANTCSMALIIGNPTNIFLATSSGIDFLSYFKIMLLPTLFGGITAYFILYLLFRRALYAPIEPCFQGVRISNKPLLAIGLVHLIACTVLLIISSYINIEMWLVSSCFAVSLFISTGIYSLVKKVSPREIIKCLKRTPWELIPFVLSMFVFVLALNKYQITSAIGNFLGDRFVILKYGFSSVFFANIINNIPMSVLFSSIVLTLDESLILQGVYATIIGSNIGAFLTPLGALAGIMWLSILKKHDINLSFLKFMAYGVIIAIPTLSAALGGLYLAFL